LRSLLLAKNGLNKVRAHHKELKQIDLDDSIKSLPPGEWCLLTHPELSGAWVCFINPIIDEKYSCINLLTFVDQKNISEFSVESYIQKLLLSSFAKRQRYAGYAKGARIFYGASDGLPGLIIDQFLNKAVIQINTAGVDKFRSLIKETIDGLISGTAYFLDNAKYREKEFLPTFTNEALPSLEIEENGLKYALRAEVIQKVGFYYDHRENRYQLMQIMGRLNKKFTHATDLFCYAGAWGLSALKGGVESVSFVDQGDFENEIKTGLDINNFQDRGQFYRSDVFKFLDDAIQKNNFFDIVLCDPPAFAKSQKQKDQALEGYSKLHRKVIKASKPGALLSFSSCTHYVSHDEFQKNILDAALKENKKLQLIHSGMQGWDHPVTSLMDKSNYIKCYFYLMES
jgi:23S rRNA (cytosine1962-C5)-methyltransferase